MDMMHSGTPSRVKGNVLHHSADQTKCLRLLIATTADGMEANCKGLNWVIHFDLSKSIEAYVQESSHCGHNGEQRYALLLYDGLNVKAADSNMNSWDMRWPWPDVP